VRTIAAVVLGYIVMAIFVMTGLTVAWYLMGPQRAFNEGTVEVSVAWIAVNLPLSLAAAVLGGWVASRVGDHPRSLPVYALAGLVLALGVVSAGLQSSAERPSPEVPVDELTTTEAAKFAIQPAWYGFVLPLIGVGGVLAGGAVARKAKESRGESSGGDSGL